MADINNYNPLVAYVPKTSAVIPVVSEAPSPEPIPVVVDTSGDTVTISSSRQAPTNAEALTELLLSHKTVRNIDLSANRYSDDPDVSQKAKEQYQSLSKLYTPNIRNQYAGFEKVYDADGFIYIAGRGLEPYSNDGTKYPTQEDLQKQADTALKQYLSVSSPISAANKLSQIGATGKEPTPEEQVEIAELLKQEVERGSLSKDEIKNIKSKLGDAHIGLIPDEAPETQSLRKLVGGLVSDLNNLNSRNDSINQAWFKAVNSINLTFNDGETNTYSLNQEAKELEKIRNAGLSIAYAPELEPALT